MTVSITWSLSAGGSAVTNQDTGTSTNGDTTTSQEIFIRHDGANSLTNCKFFFLAKANTYEGDATATEDFSELIAWGDATESDNWGGIQLNLDSVGGYSGGATWDMSETQKTSTDNKKFTVRTGVGNSVANGILLPTSMSSNMVTPGEIPAGVEDVAFSIRMKIPNSEDIIGTREFSMGLSYTFTS